MIKEDDVVVTGWGCVTPLGVDTASTWTRLVRGEGVRGGLCCVPVEGCRVVEGAEVVLPELPWVSPKEVGRLSRASRLALPAAREALGHAGLLDGDGRSVLPTLECSVSTTAGGMELGEAFLRGVWAGDVRGGQAARVSRYPTHQQISDLQQHLGFSGPVMIVANACASGANAIGHAADLIRAGMADVVLAGGYEALCELVFCGFDCLQALSPDACRPFDVDRNGLMLGEGAAFLVIERAGYAKARGALARGRVAGYGHTTDDYHITRPEPSGVPLEKAMREALRKAGMEPGEIGHLNAHGTGTPFNDGAEAAAFARVFGEEIGSVRTTSTKAAIGHTLGAAGAIEAVFCMMALETGELPPQINTRTPLPELADALTRTGDRLEKDAVMSVNLGFGGSNAALVFARP